MTQKQPPRYLYKYRNVSKHTLDALRSREVWCSSADALNDPFDSNCRIDTRVPADEQREIRNQMFLFCTQMNELRKGTDIVRLSNDPSLSDDLKFVWSCKEFARFAFHRSIYSLTEKPLHPLMWAHYSASYGGFLLEYDTTREAPDFWCEGSRPVTYQDRLPSVHIRDLVDSAGVKYTTLEEFEDAVLSQRPQFGSMNPNGGS
jgi:hypothetical protein